MQVNTKNRKSRFCGKQERLLYLCLVRNFICFRRPLLKNPYCLGCPCAFYRNKTFVQGFRNFVINKLVVKADCGSIFAAIGIHNFINPRPINCRKAHRARLARGINRCTFKAEVCHICARIPNSDHFGVCRRVVCRSYTVCAFTNFYTVFVYNHCTKRSAEPV